MTIVLPKKQLTAEELQIRQIKRWIAKPPNGSVVLDILPGTAKYLLEKHNSGNRPIKQNTVDRYAADMKAGRWVNNGEAGVFGKSGRINNFQHRLSACVKAGVPFTTHVVFGVPDAAFVSYDQGSNRSPADILALAHYNDTSMLAAGLRWVYLIDTGKAKARKKVENYDVLNLIQHKYPDLPDYTKMANRIYRNTKYPKGLILALCYLFFKANPKKAAIFCDAWETGPHKAEALNKAIKLIHRVKNLNHGRIHDVAQAAIFVKAWNLFVNGKSGTEKQLEYNVSTEPFPDIQGQATTAAAA